VEEHEGTEAEEEHYDADAEEEHDDSMIDESREEHEEDEDEDRSPEDEEDPLHIHHEDEFHQPEGEEVDELTQGKEMDEVTQAEIDALPSEEGMTDAEEQYLTSADAYDDILPEIPLQPQQVKGIYILIDSNSDGMMSLPEMLEFSMNTRRAIAKRDAEDELTEMDADKDGKLSRKEFLEYTLNTASKAEPIEHQSQSEEKAAKELRDHEQDREQLEIAKFKAVDKNGDGFLEPEELQAALFPETHKHGDSVIDLLAAATVKAKDKDSSGALSPQELYETNPSVEEEPMTEDEKKEQSETFKKLDKDGNGELSKEEVKPYESGAFHHTIAINHLFSVADKDKDKHITFDEFQKAQPHIEGTDAAAHLNEWAVHHEL